MNEGNSQAAAFRLKESRQKQLAYQLQSLSQQRNAALDGPAVCPATIKEIFMRLGIPFLLEVMTAVPGCQLIAEINSDLSLSAEIRQRIFERDSLSVNVRNGKSLTAEQLA